MRPLGRGIITIGAGGALLLALVLWLARGKKSSAAAGAEAPDPRAVLTIPEPALRKNPISTARGTRVRLATDLDGVGAVTYDRNHYRLVGPLVPGRIVGRKASVGDAVHT